MQEIIIDKIIKSKRRSIALEIAHDATLIVRTPKQIPHAYVRDLISKKRYWILDNQRKMRERNENRISITQPMPKEEILRIIRDRVDYFADQTGLQYRKVSLSNARKRWGSCNSKGDLRFNWRLILAPPEVLDYLVVHELMHLCVKNHSKIFWKEVEQVLPDYKLSRVWLRDNGVLLC